MDATTGMARNPADGWRTALLDPLEHTRQRRPVFGGGCEILHFTSGNYESISTRAGLINKCSRWRIWAEISRTQSSSLDGRVLAYLQHTPSAGIHVRFNDTGRDSVLVAQRVRPKVSPDGTTVAYTNYFHSSSRGSFSDGRQGRSGYYLDRAESVQGELTGGRRMERISCSGMEAPSGSRCST